jgi:hypothetical protein
MDGLPLLRPDKLRKEAQAVEDVALSGVVRANQNIEGSQIQRHIPQALVIANADLIEHTNLSLRITLFYRIPFAHPVRSQIVGNVKHFQLPETQVMHVRAHLET